MATTPTPPPPLKTNLTDVENVKVIKLLIQNIASPPTLPTAELTDGGAIEAIKLPTQNIQSDNAILNTKLVQYIAVQSLLVVALEQGHWNPYLVGILGIVTSLCWLFSMNTTNHFIISARVGLRQAGT